MIKIIKFDGFIFEFYKIINYLTKIVQFQKKKKSHD